MKTSRITRLCALLAVAACGEGGNTPTQVPSSESAVALHAMQSGDPAAALHSMHQPCDPAAGLQSIHQMAAVTVTPGTPFTFRAPVDPFRLHQLPDFLLHSTARKDVVFQQSIFQPGSGPWHTHPGPSFVYVLEGQIKLQRHNAQDGCTETQVYQPGNLYMEIANEVHRAVVVSATPVVVLVTRLNIPVGGAITIMAADPGC